MTATIDTTAAELEGLVPISKEQLALLRKARAKIAKISELQAELNEIRDQFRAEMEAEGVQGLIYQGKVAVRKSDVSTPRIDTKALKDKYPEIAAELLLVTESVRMNIK